jgi:hypothetical protein
MTRNLAYFDDREGIGYLTSKGTGNEITTTRAQCDRYIKIDDSRQYPQLCAGGKRMGNTLIWAKEWRDIPRQFARDTNASLYKTREGYERARDAQRKAIGTLNDDYYAMPA